MEQQSNQLEDTIPAELKQYFFKDRLPPNLLDYDVIGFDADHCLVKYNSTEFTKMLVTNDLNDLHSMHGYPQEILDVDIDEAIQVCLNGSVFDIENGLIIQLVGDREVARALRGFEAITQDEIIEIYGNPPIFTAYQYPNTTHLSSWRGAYWVFMTQFDSYKVVSVAKIIELKSKGLVDKSYYDVAMDIRDLVIKNFVHVHDQKVEPIKNVGTFFPAVLKNPKLYVQPQPQLRATLEKLKKAGKRLFMGTNAHYEYFNIVMSHSIGDDWRTLFDIVCVHCKKPLFFWDKKYDPFYLYDPVNNPTFKGKKVEELKKGCIYSDGNSKMLTNYFKKELGKEEIQIAFFGDQYITDVYAASTNVGWDGFGVVEEILLYDDRYTYGQEHQLYKNDYFWGKDTFFYIKTSKGEIKKNYFLTQLEEGSRYIVPLLRNIDILIK